MDRTERSPPSTHTHIHMHTLEASDRKEKEENLRDRQQGGRGAEDRDAGTPVVGEGRAMGKRTGIFL